MRNLLRSLSLLLLPIMLSFITITFDGCDRRGAEVYHPWRNYFEMVRQDNYALRQEQLYFLSSIINNPYNCTHIREQAENEKLFLISSMIIESMLEGMIMSIGFLDSLVTISHIITVLVLVEHDLCEDLTGHIVYTIMRETHFEKHEIRIMEVWR